LHTPKSQLIEEADRPVSLLQAAEITMSSPPESKDADVQPTNPEEPTTEGEEASSKPDKDPIMDENALEVEVKEQDRWLPIANGMFSLSFSLLPCSPLPIDRLVVQSLLVLLQQQHRKVLQLTAGQCVAPKKRTALWNCPAFFGRVSRPYLCLHEHLSPVFHSSNHTPFFWIPIP
jgi:hypothetical protein